MDNPIYDFPIDKVLEALGSRMESKDMYFSPMRDERTASIHVDRVKNVWYDHGLAVGGTNVDLVMMARNCSKEDAKKFIRSLSPNLEASVQESRLEREKIGRTESKLEIREVKPVWSYYIRKYAESRKIPEDLLQRYCREVIVRNKERGQNFNYIGFENNNGGFAMKAPSGFKYTNKAGITTIDTSGERSVKPSSESVAVFEGFFDFLSWMVMQNTKTPTCDIVVLNSVTNLDRALDYLKAHKSVIVFTDRDDAGRLCMERMKSLLPGKEVKDMSELYKNHKDLNEMLVASRGYGCSMSHGK